MKWLHQTRLVKNVFVVLIEWILLIDLHYEHIDYLAKLFLFLSNTFSILLSILYEVEQICEDFITDKAL